MNNDTTFDDFNFEEGLASSLSGMNFKSPTPVQALAIPKIMEGKDLIACAQTGTGKTAAYLLPVINHIIKNKTSGINTLILVPTRELAMQVDQVAEGLIYFAGVSTFPVIGGGDGSSYERERTALKKGGADIIIATPGRLISHLTSGYVFTQELHTLVLDEADKMLDMGFFDDILRIIKFLPESRQNVMFSATMPPKIRTLAAKILDNPEQISISISKPAEKIKQEAYLIYDNQKLPLLLDLLKSFDYGSIIIFCSTKISVRELEKELRKQQFNAKGIHSDLEQKEREVIFNDFKNRQIRILIGTDLISRGIDVENIDLVMNYNVPGDAEDYIHRIGRTARASSSGRAITFINEQDQQKFRRIEKLMEKEVEKIPLPEFLGKGPEYKDMAAKKSGNFKKRRPFKKPGDR
ncbi:MAG: DEAD/DEAH box helicase [Cytophagaceae bacterium]